MDPHPVIVVRQEYKRTDMITGLPLSLMATYSLVGGGS